MSFKQALAKLGLDTRMTGKSVMLRGNLAACLRMSEAVHTLPFQWPRNREVQGADYLSDQGEGESSTEWIGGTYAQLRADLNGKLDMRLFEKAFSDFQKSGLRQSLETVIPDCTPKRKRRFTEQDGEWQYERRFDDFQFQECYRKLSPGRIVDIYAGFFIRGMSNAEDINRYGALVWGISQLIESCGIQTRILYCQNADDVSGQGHGVKTEIVVKQPGQYLAPSLLAACFTSRFYRRMGFGLRLVALESEGIEMRGGMGSSVDYAQRIRFEAGKLMISSNCKLAYSDDIKKEILAAIRG